MSKEILRAGKSGTFTDPFNLCCSPVQPCFLLPNTEQFTLSRKVKSSRMHTSCFIYFRFSFAANLASRSSRSCNVYIAWNVKHRISLVNAQGEIFLLTLLSHWYASGKLFPRLVYDFPSCLTFYDDLFSSYFPIV